MKLFSEIGKTVGMKSGNSIWDLHLKYLLDRQINVGEKAVGFCLLTFRGEIWPEDTDVGDLSIDGI